METTYGVLLSQTTKLKKSGTIACGKNMLSQSCDDITWGCIMVQVKLHFEKNFVRRSSYDGLSSLVWIEQ
jgi:hypothetical protein